MKTNKINSFTNRYTLLKTLQFQLLPNKKTEEYFNEKILSDDKQRSEEYKVLKTIIDKYLKTTNDIILSKSIGDEFNNILMEFKDYYFKKTKSPTDYDRIKKIKSSLREMIMQHFIDNIDEKDDKNFLIPKRKAKKLEISNSKLTNVILPGLEYENHEHKEVVDRFYKWATYIKDFTKNRNNMYTTEDKSTAIPHRIINDNLPRFLDNCRIFAKIKESLPKEMLDNYNETCKLLGIYDIENYFDINFFQFTLSQKGIDAYNRIIGAYKNSDQSQEEGLNQIINRYNQENKDDRLPLLKRLYKQILGDSETISYVPERFNDDEDNDVLHEIENRYQSLVSIWDDTLKIFNHLNDYDIKGIYIRNDSISNISKTVTGDWSAISEQWNSEYDDKNHKKKKDEKYYKDRNKAYKNTRLTIYDLQRLIDKYSASNEKEDVCIRVIDYYCNTVGSMIKDIISNYKNAESLLTSEYNHSKKLAKNDEAIEKIKMLLDSIKKLEWLIKELMGDDSQGIKDEVFYGDIQPIYDALRAFDRLYDKVRNYITKKPYSKDKIKLTFQNPQFLIGWDVNKEKDYQSFLLKRDDKYFVAILNHDNCNKIHKEILQYKYDDDPKYYEKIIYKQIPDAAKYISIKQVKPQNPPDDILNIFIQKKKKIKLSREEEMKIIDYSINDFLKNYHKIIDSHGNSYFDFKFKFPSEYKSFNDFCDDVNNQSYTIRYSKISEKFIMNLVNDGKIYLFQIYNKDFSEFSKGTPNLHTLYFKMLFDERNLKDVVYKLSGGAEMFYRYPSLKPEETTIHHAGETVENKNPLKPGKKTLKHDIIKDRRFTERQFSLHIPIMMNFKAEGINNLNNDVRYALKNSNDNYVIGIDRGERHLLYVTVINSKGEIVKQYSLNIIKNMYKDDPYETDYHKLLGEKEKKRDEARKNWKTIEGIKELKEGYISQAVHKICQLVVKYDAIIAMEDLNPGFKRNRTKVEKQVYQKFEKMLIDKLNYLVIDKNMDPEENGGLLKAYQLTNKFESFIKMGKQNGFIFYVPAYLTSKIDPVTGFVDLLKPKYESEIKTKNMISNFDFVRYNAADDLFEFGIDYSRVERGSQSYFSKWTVCTNGERILSFRNKDNNSEWDNKTVILTKSFKDLFDKHGICYPDGEDIKDQLQQMNGKDFFSEFTELLRLTLQMRNSKTGTDIDYLISPVRDKNGKFYNSDDFSGMEKAPLPENADANGAYNIARKALWCIEQIKATEDDKLDKVKLAMTNKEWLEYAQKG
jgi:hypothetical protein